MFRPSRAAAAAAEKKIKRDIEEILLPSDVKENYHRSDLAVRMATKKGKGIPSTRATTTTTLKTAADDTMTMEEQPRTKKAKTTTSTTTAPIMSEKTPPPPSLSHLHSIKTVMMLDDLADAVENGPLMGRSTTLLVNKTLEFSQMFSPLYPQVIDFAKRVRRHG
jgi:hypothetical protein